MSDKYPFTIRDFDEAVLKYPTLLDAAQMRAVDEQAIVQGLDSFGLMNNAAQGVCEHVLDLLASQPDNVAGNCVLVLAGPGNNGGDGLVAARKLRDNGCTVTLLRIGPLPREGSDAAKALAIWNAPCLSLQSPELAEHLDSATIIIDALFGAGLSRVLDTGVASLVERVNASPALIVAVDVPSGLDGNRHQAFTPCIQAHSTVTFFRYKPAHVLYPGRQLCGSKSLVQIGLSEQQCEDQMMICNINVPRIFQRNLPLPGSTGHKFHRGHVLVRSGPLSSTGAARLSAGTAMYAGAGLVTLASGSEAMAVNASHLTAVMLALCDDAHQWQALLQDKRINTLVIGPGNGVNDQTRQFVELALLADQNCVLDADAISCWEGQGRYILPLMAAGAAELVLTPHTGEFTRLFGQTDVMGLPSRLHQARAAARLSGSTIIYKGADTIIANKNGRACINANAPPWLATAGAGDVLAGLVAALIAQGMPVFEASCAAVWLHGSAATTLGYPLCAEQLVRQVGVELSRLVSVDSDR